MNGAVPRGGDAGERRAGAGNGAERVVVLEKAPRSMRGGNTHWSGGVLRFAFDDPREIGPLASEAEHQYEDFYGGIELYTKADIGGTPWQGPTTWPAHRPSPFGWRSASARFPRAT